jgi:hypothetical protein
MAVEVALAMLHLEDRLLMQVRDGTLAIVAPFAVALRGASQPGQGARAGLASPPVQGPPVLG